MSSENFFTLELKKKNIFYLFLWGKKLKYLPK